MTDLRNMLDAVTDFERRTRDLTKSPGESADEIELISGSILALKCPHLNAVPVGLLASAEVVAWLCTDCGVLWSHVPVGHAFTFAGGNWTCRTIEPIRVEGFIA